MMTPRKAEITSSTSQRVPEPLRRMPSGGHGNAAERENEGLHRMRRGVRESGISAQGAPHVTPPPQHDDES